MVKRHLKTIKELRGQFLYLMVALVIVLITYSLFESTQWSTYISWFIGLLIFGAAVYADSDNLKHLFLASALGITYLIFSFFYLFSQGSLMLNLLSSLSSVLFFVYTIILILSSMLRKHEVRPNTIYGAISIYLIIGFVFSTIFAFFYFTNPSFLISPSHSTLSNDTIIYFSFITLTTLGYGDIIPGTSFAGTLALFEAIIGQLYLTVLVALLISNFIPKRKQHVKKSFVQKKLR